MATNFELIELTACVVAGFVSHNMIPATELPGLIQTTFDALSQLSADPPAVSRPQKPPAVPIAESVRHDYIICLDDGKRLKTLKRYLQRKYALTPEQYRARWQLPEDYPMVAPAYSEFRSSLARRKSAPRVTKGARKGSGWS